MTKREFEQELARATGESLGTIRHRGFSLVEIPEPEPLIVDWDEQQAGRVALLPNRSASKRAA
jgi:hypothetical protein